MRRKHIVGNIDEMFAAFSKYDTIRARQIESLKRELGIVQSHTVYLTKELAALKKLITRLSAAKSTAPNNIALVGEL